jgi:hypothetical protein
MAGGVPFSMHLAFSGNDDIAGGCARLEVFMGQGRVFERKYAIDVVYRRLKYGDICPNAR